MAPNNVKHFVWSSRDRYRINEVILVFYMFITSLWLVSCFSKSNNFIGCLIRIIVHALSSCHSRIGFRKSCLNFCILFWQALQGRLLKSSSLGVPFISKVIDWLFYFCKPYTGDFPLHALFSTQRQSLFCDWSTCIVRINRTILIYPMHLADVPFWRILTCN